MVTKAVLAVFKRNLAAYFGSPGYIFICAFLLSAVGRFLASGILRFQSANLDQLNRFLPHICLGSFPRSLWYLGG